MTNKIPTFTITATTVVSTSNRKGKLEYKAIQTPATVTPDSQGEWCKVSDHLDAMVDVGSEIIRLRERITELEDKLYDLGVKV